MDMEDSTMEEHILEILESIIEGRNEFFVRTMQLTPHQHRPQMLSRYMLNEIVYLEMINRMYQNQLRRQLASAVVTFTLPPSNFSDPVVVAPTQAQIDNAIEDISSSTGSCAICQDAISSGGCRIEYCRHEFHRNCLTNWFGMSVRCPVCRHDIRNQSGGSTQTPSGEE